MISLNLGKYSQSPFAQIDQYFHGDMFCDLCKLTSLSTGSTKQHYLRFSTISWTKNNIVLSQELTNEKGNYTTHEQKRARTNGCLQSEQYGK